MKKTLWIAGLASVLTLMGCEKECTSNGCGTIENWGTSGGGIYYWVEVKNPCSGNLKLFYVDEDEFSSGFYLGERFCTIQVDSW